MATPLPASTGWTWIKEGFGLFKRQPGSLALLFLTYTCFMLTLGFIPVAGQVLTIVLIPVFSVAFMQACASVDRNEKVLPVLLATGFRKPLIVPLTQLGILYLVCGAVALGATVLVDGGIMWQLATGQLDAKSAEAKSASLAGPLFMALAFYIPAAMAFCFAAPLILWQQMGVGKSIFYSFFAVLRELRAFLVYALAWMGLVMLASQLVALVAGRSQLAVALLAPVSVVLTLVMHCSSYASYRQLFGKPTSANDDIV